VYLTKLSVTMKQKKENQFWDSFAGKYDKFISKYANKTYARSLELMELELSIDSNILEVATGTGLISFAIADMVNSISAIDYAPEMIKIANAKLERLNTSNIKFSVNLSDKTVTIEGDSIEVATVTDKIESLGYKCT